MYQWPIFLNITTCIRLERSNRIHVNIFKKNSTIPTTYATSGAFLKNDRPKLTLSHSNSRTQLRKTTQRRPCRRLNVKQAGNLSRKVYSFEERFCGEASSQTREVLHVFLKMESKFKLKEFQDCEKTNLSTPFSINDILTKENEAKCQFENGMFSSFGGKMSFLSKAAYKEGFPLKKEVLEKSLKYYDDCNGFSDYADDGVLDMSRKNHYPVTELSGKFFFLLFFFRLIADKIKLI